MKMEKYNLFESKRNWKINFHENRNYTMSYMLWIDLRKIISISVKRRTIQVQLKAVIEEYFPSHNMQLLFVEVIIGKKKLKSKFWKSSNSKNTNLVL